MKLNYEVVKRWTSGDYEDTDTDGTLQVVELGKVGNVYQLLRIYTYAGACEDEYLMDYYDTEEEALAGFITAVAMNNNIVV